MKFLFHNKLGRIWFLIWFLGTSLYLIIKAIRRYIEFKSLQFDKVFERDISAGVMNFYLICIINVIVMSILCVYCTVCHTGNYANDSRQFGDLSLDFKILKINLERDQINMHLVAEKTCLTNGYWNRIRHHSPAYYLSLYVTMNVMLLIPLPYLDSEMIKNGMAISNSQRHTNLDFLFKPENDDKSHPDTYRQPMSIEFFNLCLSLLLHSYSYSHVFWKYNKKFTLLFSLVVLLSGVILILDTALLEMLIKMSRNPEEKTYINYPPILTILSLFASSFLIVHQMALFEYGYIRLTETILPRYTTETIDRCTTYNDEMDDSNQFLKLCKHICTESKNGVLVVFVLGLLSAILNNCIKLAYIYKSITVIYVPYKDSLVLANSIVTIVFFLLIMILWVFLLLKSNWPIRSTELTMEFNGDCRQYITRHPNNVPSLPIYASVNRHPMSSPTLGQDPNFSVFCDPSNSQWIYSCSPPSCGPNDSNSDRTVSCQNGDINGNHKNYRYLRRGNHIGSFVDSPNTSHGIYSQLIKLTPQNSIIGTNQHENAATSGIIPNDISESSSNQTVHIIGPLSMDMSRSTIERPSDRDRMLNPSEYFNIIHYVPGFVTSNDVYDHGASIHTEAESTNLCSQV